MPRQYRQTDNAPLFGRIHELARSTRRQLESWSTKTGRNGLSETIRLKMSTPYLCCPDLRRGAFPAAFMIGVLLVVSQTAASVAQQPQPATLAKRAVESLKSDGQLYVGLILKQTDNEVTIAVERNWLSAHDPEVFQQRMKEERQRIDKALLQFDLRFDQWRQSVADDDAFVTLLDQEQSRIRAENEGPALQSKRFMLLTFPTSEIEKLKTRSVAKKRIAALAWKNNLEGVSFRSASDLKKELDAAGVDVDTAFFDLAHEIPAATLTDRQWKARQAMFEFQFRKHLEFQGQGELLFEVSDTVDPTQLMTRMLASSRGSQIQQLGRELGLPEFSQSTPQKKPNWIDEVTRKAAKQSCDGVLVKRIIDSTAPDRVAVEAVFLARTSELDLEPVLKFAHSSRLSTQSKQRIEDLAKDPQVQQAVNSLQQLGLGSGERLLDRALRQGAATQEALTAVTDQINSVLSRHANRIEAPWLLD